MTFLTNALPGAGYGLQMPEMLAPQNRRSVQSSSQAQRPTAPATLDSKALEATPDDKLRQAAEDFETAFIAQMLKFSGLADALTTGGGEDVAAFTDFYIEQFAEDITESGGFGLAEKFYAKLKTQSDGL